jgi:hypothetical protein
MKKIPIGSKSAGSPGKHCFMKEGFGVADQSFRVVGVKSPLRIDPVPGEQTAQACAIACGC